MYLTGIADEASQNIETQIEVTRQLGWNAIESRFINGKNIHDLSEEAFDQVCETLDGSGVHINAFGSAIANWGKDVRDDFAITEAEINRTIPRMKKLGTRFVRVMSYKVIEGVELMAKERIRRLQLILDAFSAEGITVVHENCMNYGGMSWQHTLELIDALPGIKLVYDTGNPVFNRDRSREGNHWQDPWEFYLNVKDHIAYVHVKDCLNPLPENGNKEVYTYPGEGKGRVLDVMTDLMKSGYDGGISIEPHLAAVFHDADSKTGSKEDPIEIYLKYGRQLMGMLDSIGYSHQPYQA
ncbi:sugar phosphate isomerase/epimerase [Opitutales bacterium]|nr:sugar phosphate isomerase/epimerase [Opitutales bacterium]